MRQALNAQRLQVNENMVGLESSNSRPLKCQGQRCVNLSSCCQGSPNLIVTVNSISSLHVLARRLRRFGVVFCLPLLLSAVAIQFVALQFVVPDATRRSAALGNLDDVPVAQRRAFDPRG